MLIPQVTSLPVDYHRIEVVALLHARKYTGDDPGLAFRSLRENVIQSFCAVFHQRAHQKLPLIFCNLWSWPLPSVFCHIAILCLYILLKEPPPNSVPITLRWAAAHDRPDNMQRP